VSLFFQVHLLVATNKGPDGQQTQVILNICIGMEKDRPILKIDVALE
jgi:hypothetical protein